MAFNFISKWRLNADITKLDKSIAVLPFINDSPSDSTTYFINGLMEEILNNLQKIGAFSKVLSRTSTEQYRGIAKPPIPKIAKDLDVNFIVEGSGQKYGNSYRIRVQLIEGKADKHLWGDSYEREIKETKDIYGTQSEIAQSIASVLNATITREEKGLIKKAPTSNMAAYDLYLRAKDYQKEYEKTRDLSSYHTAVNLYKTALVMDSAFAKAYTGLASSYNDRYQWETYFKENYLDSMLVLVKKALRFDEQLDEAYYLKGLYYYANGYPKEALDDFDKSLKINPNFYEAYERKGFILTWILYDYVKGIENYNKALSLIRVIDRPALLRDLGNAYLNVGFIEKAKYYFKEAFTLDNNIVENLGSLAWMEFSTENFEEALKLTMRAYEIDSTNVFSLIIYNITASHKTEAYLYANKVVEYYKKTGRLPLQTAFQIGYAFWQVGKYKVAKNYFDQQIRYGEESIKLNRDVAQRKAAHYDLASTYAFLGNKVKAYQYLDEFDKMNFYPLWWVSYAKHNPLINSIRAEERYQKILQNMAFKNQVEHDRVKKWLEAQGML